MTLKGPLVVILASLFTIANAQLRETFEHRAEYGASVGLGHYFGDLNTIGSFQRPKITAGIFYRKQFNNYVGIRFSGNYSFLGYSDAYSNNIAQKARNLSFNTDVWDVIEKLLTVDSGMFGLLDSCSLRYPARSCPVRGDKCS